MQKLSWVLKILLQLAKKVMKMVFHKKCWSLCSTFPRVLNMNQRQWVGGMWQRKCSHLALMLLHLVGKSLGLILLVFYYGFFILVFAYMAANSRLILPWVCRLRASDVCCFTRWNTWQFCYGVIGKNIWGLDCLFVLQLLNQSFLLVNCITNQSIHVLQWRMTDIMNLEKVQMTSGTLRSHTIKK